MLTKKDEREMLVFFYALLCQKKAGTRFVFSLKNIKVSVLYVIKTERG